ncbi:hypothetical protein Mal33_12620 [Rosistilla oblonga]|uniref:Pilus formation protein N-terminal domain-containing protein n=1 Tax=Rosistilla oblonga TaxID=2527990 RepID=A0A518IQD9_9BACT|nr:hypothetical protein Mal33_12620 [Rosistilla oblonga]
MRWPQRRCLARHLRRAALVSLITATSNGFSTADQPQAKLAPVQQNQYATRALSKEVRGPISTPRIIAYTAAEQVGEDASNRRGVQLIDSQVQHNPLAVIQTAAPDSKSESQSTLKFRRPTVAAAPNSSGAARSMSTLKLRSPAPQALEELPAAETRSLLTIVPPPSKAAVEEEAGVSFSISDDSLSIPAVQPETAPVELVRPGRAAIVEVVDSPTGLPADVLVVESDEAAEQESIAKKPEPAVKTELSPKGPTWKMPEIHPLVSADRNSPMAERKLSSSGSTEAASRHAASHDLVNTAPVGLAPKPLDRRSGPSHIAELPEVVSAEEAEESADKSVAMSLESNPAPAIVKESKVVVDVPQPVAKPKSKPVVDPAVVAIKSTMDPAASLVTRSQFVVSVAESRVLFAGDRIVRVSVEHPEVCNAVTTGKESVMVVGRKLGRTRVAIWTESTPNLEPDLYVIQVDGEQGESEDQQLAGKMTATVTSMFSDAQVKVQVVEDGFVVSGTTETETQARKIMQVVRSACLRRVRDEIVVR